MAHHHTPDLEASKHNCIQRRLRCTETAHRTATHCTPASSGTCRWGLGTPLAAACARCRGGLEAPALRPPPSLRGHWWSHHPDGVHPWPHRLPPAQMREGPTTTKPEVGTCAQGVAAIRSSIVATGVHWLPSTSLMVEDALSLLDVQDFDYNANPNNNSTTTTATTTTTTTATTTTTPTSAHRMDIP